MRLLAKRLHAEEGNRMDNDVTLAVIADIHGNSWALDAVLAEIDRRDITMIVDLGDSLFGPLDPAGTANRLRERDIPSISGNCERELLEGFAQPEGAHPTVAYTLAQLDARHLRWVESLPATRALTELDILLCHGTPANDDEYLLEQPVEAGGALLPDDEIARRLAGTSEAVVCCAHSHVPRLVLVAGRQLVVNPGSVGYPAYRNGPPEPHIMEAGSPHARFAVLTRRDGTWTAEHVAVAYDWHAAAEVARSNGRPDWARAITTGRAP
jgi:predicted phosphodiesterase